MKKLKRLVFAAGLATVAAVTGFATPSTQIWNPSTDIQAKGTWHLGIDNYFSVLDNHSKPYVSPTDLGLTWGAVKNLEVGLDYWTPVNATATDVLYLNAKYGIPESDSMPLSAAVGGFNFGGKKDLQDMNILYGVLAKNFAPAGRLSLGYYTGNDKVLVDETGEKANTGLIASWDKALTDKIWAAVDYASGKSFYGSLSLGGSYAFSSNTSVIFGYVIYNNSTLNPNNQFTTQVDINF